MLTVPRTLAGWNFYAIHALVAAHAHEPAMFDWKAQLPHVKDDKGKDRLVQEAVAMANGGGGFLIFGVKDDTTLPPDDRLVGVPAVDGEFAKKLGDLMARADPKVPYEVLNPPIAMLREPGMVLQVAEILPLSAPHSFDGTFFRRDSAVGATRMKTADVRDIFIRTEEQRARVRLLIHELTFAGDAAALARTADQLGPPPALRRIDTRMIAELHASLLPLLLKQNEKLSHALTEIRAESEAFNSRVEVALMASANASEHLDLGLDHTNPNTKQAYERAGHAGGKLSRSLRKLTSDLAVAFGELVPTPLIDQLIRGRGY